MSEKPIIYCYGGLGNNLFQLMLASEISHKTGQPVRVTSRNRLIHDRYGRDHSWMKSLCERFPQEIDYVEKAREDLKFRLSKRVPFLRAPFGHYISNDTADFDSKLFKYKVISGHFQNIDYYPNRGNFIEVFKNFVSEKSSFTPQKDLSDYVALHFRSYKEATSHEAPGREYFVSAMKHFYKQGKRKFLLFSDDHSSFPVACEEIGEACEVKIFKRMDEFSEFHAMSGCCGFIGSNSTFSWWGASLLTDSALRIFPECWRLSENKKPNLFPEGWIQM